jgi:hypothetical protein
VISQGRTPIAQCGIVPLKVKVRENSLTQKISAVSESLQNDPSDYQSTMFLNLSCQHVGMQCFIEWKNRLTFSIMTVVKNLVVAGTFHPEPL